MWKVEQRITNGELSFEKAATEVQEAKNSDEPSYITEGFTDFEEGYDNYPTLIYDGPFSDHILEKNPEMLKSASAVTLSDALKKAEKACGKRCSEIHSNKVRLCLRKALRQARYR